jgi:hypothetical protein
MDAEIEHLEDFVGNSECVFIRNGVEYDSGDALKHIRRKYKAARRHIKTAEDFIRLAATRSSMSGKIYLVRCGGGEIPCADWLYEELSRYREGLSGKHATPSRNYSFFKQRISGKGDVHLF